MRSETPNLHPALCYARTEDGLDLPVLDLTHPAFAFEVQPGEWEAKRQAHLRQVASHGRIPAFLRRWVTWALCRRSRLLGGLRPTRQGFLEGLPTYLMKLGPTWVGPRRVDQAIAASFPAWATRVRLQDAARMLAERLSPWLEDAPGRPLHMVNIAGGPAMDSLNALILLWKHHPERLQGRPLSVHVLDLQGHAPAFGRRALQALQAPGGPLEGLTVAFHHHSYDWKRPEDLSSFLGTLEAQALVAGSSEGGLFHYGSDAEVAANLAAFHQGTPSDAFMVGSATWEDAVGQATRRWLPLAVRTFTPHALARLTARCGWRFPEQEWVSCSQVFCLEKAR